MVTIEVTITYDGDDAGEALSRLQAAVGQANTGLAVDVNQTFANLAARIAGLEAKQYTDADINALAALKSKIDRIENPNPRI